MGWTTYGNRGMLLESMIELANMEYKRKGIAVIEKIPTPIKPIKTFQNGRMMAYWEKKSTVDFSGIYGDRAVAFDAKETSLKRLPLANIEQHQYDFMMKYKKNGHCAFIIVYFSNLDKTYRLDIEMVEKFIQENTRQSIPLKYFEENGVELGRGRVSLDYLKGV